MKTILFISTLGLALTAHAAQSTRELDARFLDELRAEVRTNHPTAAAARARLKAAEAGIRAVRLWEDPMVGIGVMAADRDMRKDDGDLRFSAEQVLPRRKLYEARQAKAGAQRLAMEAESQAAIISLEAMAGQKAIELALADEMLRIQTNQLSWVESMTANARDRLKDPSGNLSESLRLESELAQERQKIESTARQRKQLSRQLNILLGRTLEEEWDSLKLPGSLAKPPELAGEVSRLFQSNPMLRALAQTARAARLEIEVAHRERAPTFSVGIDSSVYSGGEFRQTTVAAKMSLPIFNGRLHDAHDEMARQEQLAAEREVEALERKLRGEAVAAHAEAETAARQAETFLNEVLPRAEKAALSTQNAWISSKANLLEVLDSRRVLLNAQLEERRFVAAQAAALETLRSIVPPQTNK